MRGLLYRQSKRDVVIPASEVALRYPHLLETVVLGVFRAFRYDPDVIRHQMNTKAHTHDKAPPKFSEKRYYQELFPFEATGAAAFTSGMTSLAKLSIDRITEAWSGPRQGARMT